MWAIEKTIYMKVRVSFSGSSPYHIQFPLNFIRLLSRQYFGTLTTTQIKLKHIYYIFTNHKKGKIKKNVKDIVAFF